MKEAIRSCKVAVVIVSSHLFDPDRSFLREELRVIASRWRAAQSGSGDRFTVVPLFVDVSPSDAKRGGRTLLSDTRMFYDAHGVDCRGARPAFIVDRVAQLIVDKLLRTPSPFRFSLFTSVHPADWRAFFLKCSN